MRREIEVAIKNNPKDFHVSSCSLVPGGECRSTRAALLGYLGFGLRDRLGLSLGLRTEIASMKASMS